MQTQEPLPSFLELETVTTWPGLLQRHAAAQPEALVYTFLSPGGRGAPGGAEGSVSVTFGELDRRARAIAGLLQNHAHAKKGDRALLLYPPGLDYVAAFFGCLYAGVVAVPAYPPDRAKLARTLPRIKAIAADAKATLALTTGAILASGDLDAARLALEGLTHVATDGATSADAQRWSPVALAPDDIALLQYTSGSTSSPSGVILTHRNMLHNARIQRRAWNLSRESVGISRLPLYHDLGVISCLLQPVFVGFHTVLLSPADFVQRPLRWLEAIARYRGTFAGGPNFAFDLCVRNTTAAERARLDLRSWETAFNGAEPIRPESLDRFAEAFAVSGFRRTALYPCYGLAEANFVSGMRPGAGPTVGRFDALALERGEAIASLPAEVAAREEPRPKSRALVSCGEVAPEQTLAIVDPESRTECAAGRVGEVWLSGDSVGRGYWGRSEATEATFGATCEGFGEARFLRTGDLGFVEGGHLYLTGRLKDLIIIRGANHYPQDIEQTVERSNAAMRAGCGAAFSTTRDGVERVVMVQEVQNGAVDLPALVEAARFAVLRDHEIALGAVVLLPPGAIPKTTSGKIQRRACKSAFEERTFAPLHSWHLGDARSGEADLARTSPVDATPPAASAPARSAAEIEAWLVTSLSRLLRTDPRQIDAREPFSSYGLDSLAATELSGALETWLGRRVEPTAVYEHSTVEALAKHLATGAAATTPAPAKSGRSERRPAEEPIAIIGIGCRFPGADSPRAFWSLLRNGVDAVTEIPASRWDAARHYDADGTKPGKMSSRWGGFLSEVDRFDSLFFGISPREARHMDPQQRLLLELAWEALEDAGQAPAELRGSATGVFLGMTTDDYGRMQWNRPAAIDMYSATGTLSSVAAGRVSYAFDFRGPSLSLDTACSSSLVAIHYACQSLWSGEATLALAGGVNLILTPENGISLTKLGALSADGRCKAFDDRADGFVRGEGAGLVVLKRLSQALAAGDRIYAVVRGSAVNQDGRSNGLTAPNPQAQRAVLREAYRHAGVSPGAVQYVEAHGTGTRLGDPMELRALGRVLETDRAAGDTCAVGSVKTNIGHLESAAGVAGLIKTVLALHHEALPASLHFEQANTLIPFDTLPVRVQDELAGWPRGTKPRYAGVSAFGIGGTNAHVVLEEGPAREGVELAEPAAFVLPMSARSPDALVALARSYVESLSRGPLRNVSLGDVCYTASVRRDHLEHRLCVVARSRAALVARIEAFLGGERAPVPTTTNEALAARYMRGEAVDFRARNSIRRAHVTLPSYPWQRSRHWLESAPAPAATTASRESGSRHPLLDRHIQSASGELLWEVEVGRDSHGFLQDHVLGGARVFPGLAYVEMALAAAGEALGAGPFAATEIELLAAMFVPDDGVQTVQLSLTPDAAESGARGGQFRVLSRPGSPNGSAEHGSRSWTLHARGKIVRESDASAAPFDPASIARCAETSGGEAFYESLRATGTTYGPRFQGLTSLARRTGEAVGEVRVPASLELEMGPYLFHPAILDACAQTLLATDVMHPFMPIRIERVRLRGRPRTALRSHAESDAGAAPGSRGGESLRGSVRVYDGEALVAEIVGAQLQLLDRRPRPSARPSTPAGPASYELVWNKKAPSVSPPPERAPMTWLLLADEQGVAEALAARLVERGDRCVSLAWSANAGPDSVRAALATASRSATDGPPLGAVVHLGSLDAISRRSGSAAGSTGTVGDFGCAALAVLAGELALLASAPRLWVVTRGAQQVGPFDSVASAQAPLWGFARSLSAESPRVWGGLIDLDKREASTEEHARAIERAIEEGRDRSGEDQVAVRGDDQYVPRIERRSDLLPKAPLLVRADGAYLVTGGLGGLGLKVARWLVDQGARQLLLLGRTPLPPRERWEAERGESAARIAAIRELEALGADVSVAAVDVADEPRLKEALDRFARSHGAPIRGVIHAAGVGTLRPISRMTEAAIAEELSPKVRGASNLDRLLENAPLDFFVLYSSLSAVLPSPLLAAYAASNAFLEAVAHNRRARGKPALCIHWGMWGEVGMAARAQKVRATASGAQENERDWKAGSLAPDEALILQRQLLDEGATVAIATRTDWSELTRDNPALARLPILSTLLAALEAAPVANSDGAGAAPGRTLLPPALPAPPADGLTRASLATLPAHEQLDRLVPYLKSQIEAVLALDAGSLGAEAPLDTVGYDSLAAVDLQLKIGKEIGIDVPLLALLQRGSARDLALRMVQHLKSTTPPARAASPTTAGTPEPRSTAASPASDPVVGRDLAPSLSLYQARTPTLPPATHTNSYALGGRDVVIVEPATPFESEQRAWVEWVRGLAASGRRPVALFATHHHEDHIGGLDVLSRELGVPVWMHRETWLRVGGAKPGRLLEDGDTIRLDGPVPEAWQVLHTPGHAPGHLCLWNPATRTIVAGDMVASVGTILIAPGDGDMETYLAQLARLARLDAAWALPAHGDPIAAPSGMFRQYIEERETRERVVLGALSDIGALGGTPENLVRLAYSDAPPHTWPIGLLSLRAHLEKLLREGRVVENDGVFRSCG